MHEFARGRVVSTNVSLTARPRVLLFSRCALGGLPQLSEGDLPLQELREGLQLLLQPGQASEARVRRGTQVPLSLVSLQDEAQIEPEHPSERQAHETAERVLRGADAAYVQRQQGLLAGHQQLKSRARAEPHADTSAHPSEIFRVRARVYA